MLYLGLSRRTRKGQPGDYEFSLSPVTRSDASKMGFALKCPQNPGALSERFGADFCDSRDDNEMIER